ncbi:forkhead box protein D4-like isoform X1 [Cricetulus griseus]|uniref:forkhead box protein D4-like isoform X1 n=1 Tax=Cricetulus griseus TaxID=10029 RepID=UPI00045434FE|nr:forkhead box protein D4-like isoform X1 [Cricetulus griseus]
MPEHFGWLNQDQSILLGSGWVEVEERTENPHHWTASGGSGFTPPSEEPGRRIYSGKPITYVSEKLRTLSAPCYVVLEQETEGTRKPDSGTLQLPGRFIPANPPTPNQVSCHHVPPLLSLPVSMNLARAGHLLSTPQLSPPSSDRDEVEIDVLAEGEDGDQAEDDEEKAERNQKRLDAAPPGSLPRAPLHPHPQSYLLLAAPAYAEAPRKAEDADPATSRAIPALQPALGFQPWDRDEGSGSPPGRGSFTIESIMQGVTGAAQSPPSAPWSYCHLLQHPSCPLHPQVVPPLLQVSATALTVFQQQQQPQQEQQHCARSCAPGKGARLGRHLTAVAALLRHQPASEECRLTTLAALSGREETLPAF